MKENNIKGPIKHIYIIGAKDIDIKKKI